MKWKTNTVTMSFLKCIPIMKILIGMMHNSYIFYLFKNHNRH